MAATAPEVLGVTFHRREINAEDVPELRELFNIERLPLAEADIGIEIKGVSVAVINAIGRAANDEMLGRALVVPPDGFDTQLSTDEFLLPQFVSHRIHQLPLRPHIPPEVVEGLRLELDIANPEATVLSVYSGDLRVTAGQMPEPLFNPTFKLGVLQPGRRLVIRGIRIATGYGRDDGAFQVARRRAHTHLDLPQYTAAEMREEGGAAADWSGYKTSSLVANPRHHRLTATLPAVSADPAEARAVFADACANLKERLRLVATTIDRRAEGRAPGPGQAAGFAHRGVQFTVVQLEAGLSEGILTVPGETHSIGELLRRTVYELTPDISWAGYLISAHENRMILTIRHTEDVSRILAAAVARATETLDVIQRGIIASR
jgi:DNA-directed RNA polymerase subunit L